MMGKQLLLIGFVLLIGCKPEYPGSVYKTKDCGFDTRPGGYESLTIYPVIKADTGNIITHVKQTTDSNPFVGEKLTLLSCKTGKGKQLSYAGMDSMGHGSAIYDTENMLTGGRLVFKGDPKSNYEGIPTFDQFLENANYRGATGDLAYFEKFVKSNSPHPLILDIASNSKSDTAICGCKLFYPEIKMEWAQ